MNVLLPDLVTMLIAAPCMLPYSADAPTDWKDRVSATLESFRTADGGYGKTPGAHAGSTYTSFLVSLCLQLLDRPIPDSDRLVKYVLSRRREDGGFVEIAPMKRSGTNPTAAGVGVLQLCDAMTDDIRTTVIDFADVTKLRMAFPPAFAVPSGGFFGLGGLGDHPEITFAMKPHDNGDRHRLPNGLDRLRISHAPAEVGERCGPQSR